jgi:hypothetical protein
MCLITSTAVDRSPLQQPHLLRQQLRRQWRVLKRKHLQHVQSLLVVLVTRKCL